jgi:hypothetical protein
VLWTAQSSVTLSEPSQIDYLANVIFLAICDGELTSKEAAALEEIRLSIGAKKSTLEKARKQAESGAYAPIPNGTFAAQASNLADMLYVSVLDGTLSDAEKKLISEFSRRTKLTQEQILLLAQEAVLRAKETSLSITCHSCGATSNADLNFCPQCGAALRTSVRTDFDIPRSGYAIEFAESSAGGFPAALSLARCAPSFSSCIRNKKTWYLAAWPESDFAEAIKLADALGGIRNRKSYRNGDEVEWDDLFGFVWCASERSKAYRPVEYCFGKSDGRLNPWGCRHSRMEWTDWATWLSYGRFERAGILKGKLVWMFDKQRIEHEIRSSLHRYRYCPHLRWDFVLAVLRALPSQVEVTEIGPWKFSHAFEATPGSIKVVDKDRASGFEFTSEYYADGVRPRGLGCLEEIFRKAADEVGMGGTDLTTLTS